MDNFISETTRQHLTLISDVIRKSDGQLLKSKFEYNFFLGLECDGRAYKGKNGGGHTLKGGVLGNFEKYNHRTLITPKQATFIEKVYKRAEKHIKERKDNE